MLHQALLPESYLVDDQNPFIEDNLKPYFKLVHLNNDHQLNRRILQFWTNGAYSSLIQREHPVIRQKQSHLATLEVSLNRLYRIYFLSVDRDTPAEGASLLKRYLRINRCRPLSNYEIQFMMNTSVENAFPQLPLTMLMISCHELLIQKGGKPIYPRVYSTYLRKSLNLPELTPLKEGNLFATKKGNSVYSGKTEGFIFCRK
jgi:hypothetical protein